MFLNKAMDQIFPDDNSFQTPSIKHAYSTTAESRVTHSPPEPFGDIPWIQPKTVTFKSRIDGYTLHGRLIVPPDREPGKKYPVILGPTYSNTVRNRWAGSRSTLQQNLALKGGYIGFQVDVRGSQGYGRAFREAFHNW